MGWVKLTKLKNFETSCINGTIANLPAEGQLREGVGLNLGSAASRSKKKTSCSEQLLPDPADPAKKQQEDCEEASFSCILLCCDILY